MKCAGWVCQSLIDYANFFVVLFSPGLDLSSFAKCIKSAKLTDSMSFAETVSSENNPELSAANGVNLF